MSRSRNRNADPVDGLVLLNKPSGMTSNRALQTVRRLLNARKAGHTGSLDPAATGMLPLCFGEATKVCSYLLDADKRYRVTAKLGASTDTGDADGEVTGTATVPVLGEDDWQQLLDSFLGESEQVPPMYSALKHGGQRLYKLARKGETVERPPRRIRIDEISLLEVAGARVVFRVSCSKGTYIRVLVEDIAKRAGTIAHTARLHRETVAGFEESAMLSMRQLEDLAADGPEALRAELLPVDSALRHFPVVEVDRDSEARFREGQAVAVTRAVDPGLVRVYGPCERFLGVGECGESGNVAPRRVFLTPEKTP